MENGTEIYTLALGMVIGAILGVGAYIAAIRMMRLALIPEAHLKLIEESQDHAEIN